MTPAAATTTDDILTQVPEGGYVDDEGFVIDAQGEVLGIYRELAFRVCDRETADWVLSKIADAETQAQAYRNRLAIVQRNIEANANRFRAKAAWFRARYGPELETFAQAQLAGGKSKTVILENGRISFRASKGTNRIKNMELAVNWLRREGFAHLVKTVETATVTDLLSAAESVAKQKPIVVQTMLELTVDSTGPRVLCKIETGLED